MFPTFCLNVALSTAALFSLVAPAADHNSSGSAPALAPALGPSAAAGDPCDLPIDPGPCDGSCPRWGFNSCTGQCEEFTYGCCGGNANNFMTQEECESACPVDPCALPIDPGPCDGVCPRWAYNTCTGQCEEFTWGCCRGNANNFMTQQECESACQLPINACKQPIDPGPCDGVCPRWAHNPCTGQCEEFIWGCCGGNANNFASLAECEAACGPNEICSLPLDPGPCTAVCPRWGYSYCAGGCVPFIWGCCGGNANNFATLEECMASCPAPLGCSGVADCADFDGDQIRDNNCLWWACTAGVCSSLEIDPGDMGGAFGACAPDFTIDANDRFHALNCFSNQNTLGQPGYPCEANPPLAMNVDAGGAFGDCAPDGVCDINDAYHVLAVFEFVSQCTTCQGGAAPAVAKSPGLVRQVDLHLQASAARVRPGALIQVDVLLAALVPDLRGYQLHVQATGGVRGALELVDIVIHPGTDYAFAAEPFWKAFNVDQSQMLAGLDGAGVNAPAGAYLATFIWRATPQAAGTFAIELLHGEPLREQRSFLFATAGAGLLEIGAASRVQVHIDGRLRR